VKRYQTAEAMQDDLEETLHRRAAMGSCEILTRTDVETYLEKHFGGEIRNQREFLARVGRGEVTGQAPSAEAYPQLAEEPQEDDAPTKIFEQPEEPGLHGSAAPPGEREQVHVGSDMMAVPVAAQEDIQSTPTIIDAAPEDSVSKTAPSPPPPPPPPAPPPPPPRPSARPSVSSLPPYIKPPEHMVVTDRIEKPTDINLRPKSYWWLWLLVVGGAIAAAWWVSQH
jgi:hypothetical protein